MSIVNNVHSITHFPAHRPSPQRSQDRSG